MVRALPRMVVLLGVSLALVAAQALVARAETEPNDSLATASPISANQVVPGSISENDVDWYRFTTTAANRTFVVEIIDDSRTIPGYELSAFDADGDPFGPQGSRIQFETGVAGDYFVRVRSTTNTDGDYRIRLLPRYDQGLVYGSDGEPDDVFALAGPINLGWPGTLNRTVGPWGQIWGGYGADQDTYRFTANAGSRYRASMTTDLSWEPTEVDALQLFVYSADGTELASSDTCQDEDESCVLDFTPTESGLYFLQVTTIFGYGYGPYRLTLELVPTDPGAFRPQLPDRVLDTRIGVGVPRAAVGPGGSIAVQVADVAGGSPQASAVSLNVAVVSPTRGGHLTAYPSGSARPLASNLNFAAGQTRANLVMVPVGPDGKVRLHNASAGTVHLVADRTGSFAPGVPVEPGAFVPLQPTRLLDTRSPGSRPVAGQSSLAVQVAGAAGVPASGVSAVALTVAATGATRTGHITAYPSGQTQPEAANLNFAPGVTSANLVVVPLGTDGRIRLYNGSSAAVHLVADVAGYYRAGTPTRAGMFVPLRAARILDTRWPTTTALAANATRRVSVGGAGRVPTDGVSAVVMNVAVTQPRRGGNLVVYPSTTGRPMASNLNFVAGQTIANLVTSPLGPGGLVDVVNNSAGSVHAIADVAGYYRDANG